MTNEKIPDWLAEPNLQQCFAAIAAAGGEARAVGGCVRDFLLGMSVGDIDLASTLEPEKLMALGPANGWKTVPTGIDHGTVTLVLPSRALEITTLRRDVETDGRHATVEYTDRFEEDASRRDFTINALYMDAAGKIYDYFDGEKDLAARRVRFIGDAGLRIKEDGLRILRYFRFLSLLGWNAEPEALKACAAHKHMIEDLSGERIAREMRKLLIARNPIEALAQMATLELPPLLTESPWGVARLMAFLNYERGYGVRGNPWARLMSMIDPEVRAETAIWVAERWKLSRIERRVLQEVSAHETGIDPAVVKEWLRKHERGMVVAKLLLAALDSEEELALAELITLARDWEVKPFPVTAKDLLKKGMSEGPEVGDKLRALEQRWIESDYRLSKEELIAAFRLTGS